MTRLSLALMLFAAAAVCHAASPFAGRWDLTVTPNSGRAYPDWMELAESGGKPSMRIQPRSGGARPIPDFQVDGSKLHLVFSKADAKNPEVVWDLEAAEKGSRGRSRAAALSPARLPGSGRRSWIGSRLPGGPPPSRCSTARTSPVGSR